MRVNIIKMGYNEILNSGNINWMTILKDLHVIREKAHRQSFWSRKGVIVIRLQLTKTSQCTVRHFLNIVLLHMINTNELGGSTARGVAEDRIVHWVPDITLLTSDQACNDG